MSWTIPNWHVGDSVFALFFRRDRRDYESMSIGRVVAVRPESIRIRANGGIARTLGRAEGPYFRSQADADAWIKAHPFQAPGVNQRVSG
jgi:hypothetical protein